MKKAILCTNSYAGRREQPVLIVGETPKRYRIQAIEETRIAGRSCWLVPGDQVLVPKSAVRLAKPTLNRTNRQEKP